MYKLFLENEIKSESTRKSYNTLFARISEFELQVGKMIEEWNKEDILNFLASASNVKFNTISTKYSLLKKYLEYINNYNYTQITIEDLKNIEHRTLTYISLEDTKKLVKPLKNYIDKSIILLLRYGIRGEGFEELRDLKNKDINDNIVKVNNRTIILDNETSLIVQRAMKERGYHMNIKSGKKSNFTYYHYNLESEYFWKNRMTKFNDYGLNPLKENASKDKISKILNRLTHDELTATSLVASHVVDRILGFEDSMGIVLTEIQTKSFLEKLDIKINMYSVFTLKNKVRQERER